MTTETPHCDSIEAHRDQLASILAAGPGEMLLHREDAARLIGTSHRGIQRITTEHPDLAQKMPGQREHMVVAQGLGWLAAGGNEQASIVWPEDSAADVFAPVAGTVLGVIECVWHSTDAHRFAKWMRCGVLEVCQREAGTPTDPDPDHHHALWLTPGELIAAQELLHTIVLALSRADDDKPENMDERVRAAALCTLLMRVVHESLLICVSNGFTFSVDRSLREKGTDPTD